VNPHHSVRRFIMLAVLLSCTLPEALYAAQAAPSKWALCRQPYPAPLFPHETRGNIEFTADQSEVQQQEIYKMRGKVTVLRDHQRLQADRLTYYRTTGQTEAEGHIHYEQDNLLLDGKAAHMQLEQDTGTVTAARFRLPQEHGRGKSRKIELEGKNLTILHQANYTTCDPGNKDWLLRSSRVVLNHETQVGTARNAVLSFKQVPFLYLPYISFPLNDERKSGFLTPSFGSSNKSGTELVAPYYLNIAPNYDATITPNYLSLRGLLMAGEFRYLTPRNHGLLSLDYIPRDNEFGNKDRGALSYRHDGHPFARIRTAVDYNLVSDKDYLNDFGKNLSITAVSHLPQQASVSYQGDSWTSSVQVQGFQTVDASIPDSARPYQLLPAIKFASAGQEQPNRINLDIKGELINFTRNSRVSGKRFDLQPVISLPLSNQSGFVTPAIKLEQTSYSLGDQANGLDNRPHRTIPIFSIDSGLFLERDYHWGEQTYLHTLEPRIFYLYAPVRDQADIPLFDTGIPDFNYDQLFRDNRFSNNDRVSDANQVTLALTTRLLENGGEERFNARIGQIFYFDDRQVTLSGPPETRSNSAIVAETRTLITRSLSSTADLRWDTEENQVDKGNIQLRYHPGYRRIFNISYRYRNASLRQTDASLLWPLRRNWHIIGRWNRSLLDGKNLETLAGFEYQSCCWSFTFLTRHYLKSDDKYNTAFLFQIELKGLTRLGKDIDTLLENGILGYED